HSLVGGHGDSHTRSLRTNRDCRIHSTYRTKSDNDGPLGSGEPAELSPRQLLEPGRVLAEEADELVPQVKRQLGLRRLSALGVVDEALDDPAKRLRKPVEVAVERSQARQPHRSIHHAKAAARLRDPGLPFTLELLGREIGIDAAELERPAHRLRAGVLQLLTADDLDAARAEGVEVRLELEEVAAASDVARLGIRQRLLDWPFVVPAADVVHVVREHAVDRVADDVDHAGRFAQTLTHALRNAVKRRAVGV